MVYLNRKAKEEAELERQKRLSVGKYTAEEAVKTLLDNNPHIEITPNELINYLKKLVQDGEIDCFRGGDNFIAPLTFPFRKYDTEFRWDDLNEDWLDKYTIEIRTSWRFPTPEIYQNKKSPVISSTTQSKNLIMYELKSDFEIIRAGRYRPVLIQTLRVLIGNDPYIKPSPRLVKEAWEKNKPEDVYEILCDEFKYLDNNGKLKSATWNALGKAINNLTIKKSSH